jgi:hypothetical protein
MKLLKKAMNLLLQNLGPADRLSIVTLSSTAQRLIRLIRMSNEGAGQTNIAAGLVFYFGIFISQGEYKQ